MCKGDHFGCLSSSLPASTALFSLTLPVSAALLTHLLHLGLGYHRKQPSCSNTSYESAAAFGCTDFFNKSFSSKWRMISRETWKASVGQSTSFKFSTRNERGSAVNGKFLPTQWMICDSHGFTLMLHITCSTWHKPHPSPSSEPRKEVQLPLARQHFAPSHGETVCLFHYWVVPASPYHWWGATCHGPGAASPPATHQPPRKKWLGTFLWTSTRNASWNVWTISHKPVAWI